MGRFPYLGCACPKRTHPLPPPFQGGESSAGHSSTPKSGQRENTAGASAPTAPGAGRLGQASAGGKSRVQASMDRLGLPSLARWHDRQNADPLVTRVRSIDFQPDDSAPAAGPMRERPPGSALRSRCATGSKDAATYILIGSLCQAQILPPCAKRGEDDHASLKPSRLAAAVSALFFASSRPAWILGKILSSSSRIWAFRSARKSATFCANSGAALSILSSS